MGGESKLDMALKKLSEDWKEFDFSRTREVNVKTEAQARAVINALKEFEKPAGAKAEARNILHTLVATFQNIASHKAVNVMRKEGLPHLRKLLKRELNSRKRDKDLAMFILKILVMYRDEKDLALAAKLASEGYAADDYMWSIIFEGFDEKDKHGLILIKKIGNKIPKGFIAITYLVLCNKYAVSGMLKKHPFASPEGIKLLSGWVKRGTKGQASYARSATVALPFIAEPKRTELINIARKDAQAEVRIEAEWAAALSGDPTGLDALVEYCNNPALSQQAMGNLLWLKAKKRIPEICHAKDFQAMAAMANWLVHPAELGEAPQSLEIMDTRRLFWPPSKDKRQLWLVKYGYTGDRNKIYYGVGLVGTKMMFSLISELLPKTTPEEIYARHCMWEMGKDVSAHPDSVAEGVSLIRARNPGFKLPR